MSYIVILFLLDLESSFRRNVERRVAGGADTLQWVSIGQGTWRVRTFALDQDVHMHRLIRTYDEAEFITLARETTEASYGDVVRAMHVLRSDTGIEGLEGALRRVNLDPCLNLNALGRGVVFWSPLGTDYRSRSSPGQV